MLLEIPSETIQASPLSDEELRKMHAYWRAANYLSVGQIYLMHNPLLREPLTLEHIKPRLLGLKWTPLSRPKFGLDKL
jgi:xylulose-5-phosphate/fructose-6-phosphate phosphoketolase